MNLFRAAKHVIMLSPLLILMALIVQPVFSQEATPEPREREAVLKVVQKFFDTMATRDVDGARQILIAEGRFHSVRQQESGIVIQTRTNEEYLKSLSKGNERYRERMWNSEVHIHGLIATVWTPYDFWIDEKLSHCGFDSFNLIKSNGKWKIAGGVYTVERKCKPSPLGPLKK